MLKAILLVFITLIVSNTTFSQNTKTFPVESIDTAIINKRGLEEKIKMLTKDCNWSERIGKK